MNLPRKWNFWKDYYLTYFACVPDETLDIVNIVVGYKLLNAKDVTQMRELDVWKEILKALGSSISRLDFPFNRRPLLQKMMGPVLRKYPQIVSLMGNHVGYGNQHGISGYGSPAICTKWIFARGDTNRWYHLGFEMMSSGRVNGLFLLGSDGYMAAESDRLKRVLYVFEWLVAKDGEELQQKVAPLLDGFLGGHEKWNGCYWYSGAVRTEVYDYLEKQMPNKAGQLTDLLEKNTRAILDKCHVTYSTCVAFTKLVDRMIQHVKDAAESPVPDYIALKQKMATRAELNTRYCAYDHYNFDKWIWLSDHKEPEKRIAPLKTREREKKVSSAASLLRLVRVFLNYVMMPVLKAFWRMSPQDPAYRVYPHLKSYDRRLMNWTFAPIEHVSVSHAQPQAWPVIAVAVAHLIITPLCRVIELLIHRTWTCKQQRQQEQQQGQQGREVSEGVRDSAANHRDSAADTSATPSSDEFETQLNEFINVLTRVGLMSNEHSSAIRKLFEKLSSASCE
jgi:hypothetical protein